jgi:hypothetical protein
MKAHAFITALLFCMSTAWAIEGNAIIALDAPGAMERLARENPAHFQRARNLLHVAAHMPCNDNKQAQAIAVQFNAKDLQCGLIHKTSFPAKREVNFTLDAQRYSSFVKVDDGQARIVPLK